MQTSSVPSFESADQNGDLRAMVRDLKFLHYLLKAPVYQKQRPNLYERLKEYADEIESMERELAGLNLGHETEIRNFKRKFNDWKAGLFEFLESVLMAPESKF